MVSRKRGDVRLLAAASAASNTGNWAASVALSLAVFAKTGSTVWLAASFLLIQVPSALVAPLSGMMADRFAAVGAITTFATAISFGFAGFLVEAAGWRPVYIGGGLIDIACAAVMALTLRRKAHGELQAR